jgi:hypothetical protein
MDSDECPVMCNYFPSSAHKAPDETLQEYPFKYKPKHCHLVKCNPFSALTTPKPPDYGLFSHKDYTQDQLSCGGLWDIFFIYVLIETLPGAKVRDEYPR